MERWLAEKEAHPQLAPIIWEAHHVRSVWARVYELTHLRKKPVPSGIMAAHIRTIIREFTPTEIPARIAIYICQLKAPDLAEELAQDFAISETIAKQDIKAHKIPVEERLTDHWSHALGADKK